VPARLKDLYGRLDKPLSLRRIGRWPQPEDDLQVAIAAEQGDEDELLDLRAV
jgi:hypothetical protein